MIGQIWERMSISQAVVMIVLSIVGMLLILPFLWMISTSLKISGTEFFYPPKWIPDPITFDNYKSAMFRGDFARSYWNSIKVAALTVIPTVMLAAITAYAFAKIPFIGKNAIFFGMLMLIMIPGEVTLIPNLLLMKGFGWLDQHISIIVPHIFGGGTILVMFIMRQNYLSIPDALIESAKIDGASHFRIYFSIVFPISRAAIATITIIAFMGSWNDFIYPLIYITTPGLFTLPLALAMFQQAYGQTDWTVWMAAATISVLPILIVYLLAQKQFIDSMALSGIK